MKCLRCGQMLLRQDLDRVCPSCGYTVYDAIPRPVRKKPLYMGLETAARRMGYSVPVFRKMCREGKVDNAVRLPGDRVEKWAIRLPG